MNTDWEKAGAFPQPVIPIDGAGASRRAIGAANFHPLSAPTLRAWPSSGCSGRSVPRASSRALPPLIRRAVGHHVGP